LLQLLRKQYYLVRVKCLAEYLKTSVRDVCRDIGSLHEQGVNIEDSAGIGFQFKENFLLALN